MPPVVGGRANNKRPQTTEDTMRIRKFAFWVFLGALYACIYAFVGLLIALDSMMGDATRQRIIIREAKETLQVWQSFVKVVREKFLEVCDPAPPGFRNAVVK